MSKKIYIGSTEIAGSDGKSAYQSWLDQGNVGTEAQFVASLKGADGKDGKDGAQGNTGSSVDYPYELVNNVTTNDATKGLSAAQGKVLDDKISQLGLEVNNMSLIVEGGEMPSENVTPSTTFGYYYYISNNVLKIDTNSGSQYSGTITSATTNPTDGLDISAYIGRKIGITISGQGTTSQRKTVIVDENYGILWNISERDYVSGYTEVEVPANAKWLFWSAVGSLTSITVAPQYIGEGLVGDVAQIKPALRTALIGKDITTFPINLKDCNYTTSLTASGGYTAEYAISTHPIRVIPGMTINLAYRDIIINGSAVTPKVRIGYYATKEIGSIVSMGVVAYGNPSSVVIPEGVNYMRISISTLTSGVYTRNVYTDGDITLSWDSQDFYYDFSQEFSDIDNFDGASSCEIRRAELMRGEFQVSGFYRTGQRSTTKKPLMIPEGVTSIVMRRPDNNYVYFYKATWLDENYSIIGYSDIDNYERLEVASGAKYCYITIQKYNENYYGDYIPEDAAFFFNLGADAFSDDSIIKLNEEKETLAKLLNLKFPSVISGVKQPVPLSILFFTDIHGSKENLARLMQFYNYYKHTINDINSSIDVILSGGDNVQVYNASGAFNYWGQVSGADNILNTVGNHDAAANSSLSSLANKTDVYNVQFAPYIANWDITQPSNAASEGLMYYYKDFATQKIRLVVLDCIYWDATELAWFEGVLASAKTNDYAVIGVSHYPIGYTTKIECNFLSEGFSSNGGARLTSPIDSVDTFISGGGKFICWLSGHTHCDGIGTVDGHANQLNIIGDTAGFGSSAVDSASLQRTKLQDCFNIYGVDTSTNLIKIVRIGRDYDHRMRHIGEMCIDYSTKQVLYTR